MHRKEFLKASTLLDATALVLRNTNAFTENLTYNSIDKLVDVNVTYQ